MFKTNEEKIAKEISNQMGKPIQQAKNEIKTMLDKAKIYLKLHLKY